MKYVKIILTAATILFVAATGVLSDDPDTEAAALTAANAPYWLTAALCAVLLLKVWRIKD